MKKLSILICTLPERSNHLDILVKEILRQCEEHNDPIEIFAENSDRQMSIGLKRNRLLEKVTGKYLCFIDDDDMISPNYIKHIMEGIEKDVDCISLRGEMTTDGLNPEIFEHSIKYNAWKTNNLTNISPPTTSPSERGVRGEAIKYERYPNHLNTIRSSIAKEFQFPTKNHGEDHAWSKQIHESGLIKTEHYVPEVTYYYKYISKK